MNIDKFLEMIRNRQYLEEKDMKGVCLRVREVLAEEATVVSVSAPVVVVGNIHGQIDGSEEFSPLNFVDLLEAFRVAGELPFPTLWKKYLFLGDYVNRGFHSLETITLLFLFKLKYGSKITLLRGNHESRKVTQIYGFYDEVVRKYGRPYIWNLVCENFDFLPLCAVIGKRILCVHAGMSPDLPAIDDMYFLKRKREIPKVGPLADLLWSDPSEEIDTWKTRSKGSGWLFGSKVAKEFNHVNSLKLICRSHQMIMKGFMYHFPEKSIVTLWSAPNYNYRMGNVACMFAYDEDLHVDIRTFKENKEIHSEIVAMQTKKPMYFL